jgi:amino acid transporter
MWTLVLLIFVPTFGFRNITNNGVALGLSSIPSWIIVTLLYFLPLSLIFAEMASANEEKSGGIYDWIEVGLGSNWAFIGSWSYFVANLFYLQYVFTRIPIIASWMIFGENRFETAATYIIPVMGIILCILLTLIATRGVKVFSKISDFGGKFTLAMTATFIIFAIVGVVIGKPSATTYTTEALIPKFDTAYFATFAWLLLAVSGAEIGGTYINELENPKKSFAKGVFIATGFIAIAYILGSVALSFIISPKELADAGLRNAEYVVYKMLAESWGLNGGIIIRIYSAILMFTSVAAYVLWIESPVRVMFAEVPEGTFPKALTKKDEKGTLHTALWVQCLIVSFLQLVPLLSIDSMESLFVLITDLTSLSLIVPFMVLAAAYLKFRLDGKEAPLTIMKSKKVGLSIGVLVLVISVIAFVGAGLDYAIGAENSSEFIKLLVMTYGGPILFIFLGFVIRHISSKGNINEKKEMEG